jgi:glycerol-3-phosphate dehydrogenase
VTAADAESLVTTLMGYGLSAATASRLVRVYGARAGEVVALVRRDPALGQPLAPGGDAIGAEVVFAFESEYARRLTDVLMRRSMLGLSRDLGASVMETALEFASEYQGWNADRVAAERATLEAERAALALTPLEQNTHLSH